MMNKKLATTLVAALALTAVPAVGQQMHRRGEQENRGEMPGMMARGMGMMSAVQTSPAALIRAAEQLGLDEAQLAALTEIEERFEAEHSSHMEMARTHGPAAMDPSAPDWAEYEAALSEAAGDRVKAHVAMVRASVEAKAVLTTEQLETLEGGMAMMNSMMPGMMERMMQMRGQGSMCMEMMGTHAPMDGADAGGPPHRHGR